MQAVKHRAKVTERQQANQQNLAGPSHRPLLFWSLQSSDWLPPTSSLALFENSPLGARMGGRRGFYRIELRDPRQDKKYSTYSLQQERASRSRKDLACATPVICLNAKHQLARFLVCCFQCFSSLLRGAMQRCRTSTCTDYASQRNSNDPSESSHFFTLCDAFGACLLEFRPEGRTGYGVNRFMAHASKKSKQTSHDMQVELETRVRSNSTLM